MTTPDDADDDRILISALEHYSYCPRQCALIHVEQVFAENTATLQGQQIHAHADQPTTAWEEGKRVERALPLWSDALGLLGKADVVEFYDDGRVEPVEYKRGTKGRKQHDDVQLCAQAFCLEEMLQVAIAQGQVYYHTTHARRIVPLTPALRATTRHLIDAVRALLQAGSMPPPVDDDRCTECSLRELCQPELVGTARAATPDPLFLVDDEGA